GRTDTSAFAPCPPTRLGWPPWTPSSTPTSSRHLSDQLQLLIPAGLHQQVRGREQPGGERQGSCPAVGTRGSDHQARVEAGSAGGRTPRRTVLDMVSAANTTSPMRNKRRRPTSYDVPGSRSSVLSLHTT